MPFYAGVTDFPASFKVGDHWVFNRDSARWAFDYVDFHVQVAYNRAIEEVKKARVELESKVVARIPEIDREAGERFKKSPEEGIGYLNGFCLSHAASVVQAWWKLGDDLLVKYNKLGDYDPEKRSRGRTEYPEWWRKAVKIFDAIME